MALRINGELVGEDRLYREFLQLSGGRTVPQVEQHSPTECRALLQAAERNVVQSVLLFQYGIAQNITVSDREAEEERRRSWGSSANQSCGAGVTENMAAYAMVRKVEKHLTRHVPRPDRREVEAAYLRNQSAFHQPERWLVSHIVRFAENDSEREEARAALTRAAADLTRGKPFAALAERYSDCKGNGGSLGWITHGTMVPEFETIVFALERRRFSEIFPTIFGLHIAIVHDHKPAGVQPLEEVRADLAKRIHDDRRLAALNGTVQDLLQRAVIEVVTEPERSIAEGEKAL